MVPQGHVVKNFRKQHNVVPPINSNGGQALGAAIMGSIQYWPFKGIDNKDQYRILPALTFNVCTVQRYVLIGSHDLASTSIVDTGCSAGYVSQLHHQHHACFLQAFAAVQQCHGLWPSIIPFSGYRVVVLSCFNKHHGVMVQHNNNYTDVGKSSFSDATFTVLLLALIFRNKQNRRSNYSILNILKIVPRNCLCPNFVPNHPSII